MKQTLWFAEMEGSHFTFRAIAPTRRGALDAVRRGLRKHCRQYDVAANGLLEYAGEGDESGDINVSEMKLNTGYRDWEEI